MRLNRIVAVLVAPALLVATSAFAQQPRIVDAQSMRAALAARAESEQAERDLVRRVLDRADARELAAGMGLDLQQADSALATLSAAELATLAEHARAVEAASLSGGATTVVISLTTLLLVLIIVILLVK